MSVASYYQLDSFPFRYSTLKSCWYGKPALRPNFAELVTSISFELEDMAGYFVLSPGNAEDEES